MRKGDYVTLKCRRRYENEYSTNTLNVEKLVEALESKTSNILSFLLQTSTPRLVATPAYCRFWMSARQED